MFRINLLLFSTFPCAVLFFAPFCHWLWQDVSPLSLFAALPFVQAAALGTNAFDILHMSDRRKDLEVIRKSRFSARNL